MHYAVASVLMRYNHPLGKELSCYLQAGPSPQLLVTATQIDAGYGNVYPSEEAASPVSYSHFNERQNVRSSYRTMNMALDAEVGIAMQAEGQYALVGIGMSRGLMSVERNTVNSSLSTGLYYGVLGFGVYLSRARDAKLR